MQITDILAQMGGLQSMARELGVSETQAASGAAALVPAILGGFKKQAQSRPAGLAGLGGLLAQLGGGGLLDDVLAPQPTNVSRGNDVLGQIFGSRDVSRAVAQNAASQSGLDPALLKKMLPMLAMLVAGYMAKQQAAGAAAPPSPAGGGLGGLLGGLLGRQAAGAGSATPDAAAPGLASMLDLNGDGNPLDDILRMVGKAKPQPRRARGTREGGFDHRPDTAPTVDRCSAQEDHERDHRDLAPEGGPSVAAHAQRHHVHEVEGDRGCQHPDGCPPLPVRPLRFDLSGEPGRPPDATVHRLGAFGSKGLPGLESISQLTVPDLPAAFPPLRLETPARATD